jgi:hypothetical protein
MEYSPVTLRPVKMLGGDDHNRSHLLLFFRELVRFNTANILISYHFQIPVFFPDKKVYNKQGVGTAVPAVVRG